MNKLKRFTSKYPDSTPVYHKYYLSGYHFEQGDFIDKLGQIEDIEEEFGINVVILFNALKNGVYYKHDYYGIIHKQISYIGKKKLIYQYYSLGDFDKEDIKFEYYDYNDYGKAWALTKEELE